MGKFIAELALTLIFLVYGLIYESPAHFIASGLFAIATQIGLLRSENNEG